MFKPNVDSEENREARSFKEGHRRRQQREELNVKKRELAERQASAAAAAAADAAAHEESQDAASVVPDAALSNTSAADADLNSRIDDIFEEFQGMGTNMDVDSDDADL
jgi:hypothetical protein